MKCAVGSCSSYHNGFWRRRTLYLQIAALRGQGVELGAAEMARDSERFRTGFDRLLSPELLTVEQDFAGRRIN